MRESVRRESTQREDYIGMTTSGFEGKRAKGAKGLGRITVLERKRIWDQKNKKEKGI